jgi:hypothetical protein
VDWKAEFGRLDQEPKTFDLNVSESTSFGFIAQPKKALDLGVVNIDKGSV